MGQQRTSQNIQINQLPFLLIKKLKTQNISTSKMLYTRNYLNKLKINYILEARITKSKKLQDICCKKMLPENVATSIVSVTCFFLKTLQFMINLVFFLKKQSESTYLTFDLRKLVNDEKRCCCLKHLQKMCYNACR